MAKNYDPTAANILSSLSVKGTTVTGGTGSAWKLPVIGEDGLLDISLFPIARIYDELELPALYDTAYVDKYAGQGSEGYVPNGSIASPFRSLTEAASYDKDGVKFSNFIVTSGTYGSESPVFKTNSSIIKIFSTGMTSFAALTLTGYHATSVKFVLSNISVQGSLTFGTTQTPCIALLTGDGHAHKVIGAVSNQSDPDVSTWYLEQVFIGPSYTVDSFEYAKEIAYVASSSRVANDSTIVRGGTVQEATDTLGLRRIRISRFTHDASGIHASITDDISVTDDSSGSDDGYEFHDITSMGQSLAEAANDTFYKKGDSPEFNNVTAANIVTNKVTASGVSTLSVKLGNIPVYIDSEDFLTVGDPESSESHAYPEIDNAEVLEYPIETLNYTIG